MSRVLRNPGFCICENKGADQMCGNRTADLRLCFCYKDKVAFLYFQILKTLRISDMTQLAIKEGYLFF